ncbi:hypothetical protein [Stenotrophomonas maltophilia]|uniref:hypothetical protein n=1 Tax=Stenotrophomonas maltophilia TaxID=40324 RepID=UPI00296E3765|nr:hypothetical protein [Stenotrophomonas maltophilia]
MPASIGGAGIGTGGALHFSGGSGAMSTVIWVAVVLKGLLRIGRLILRTRFGRQGLLRRNLITVFLLSTTPAKNFHIRAIRGVACKVATLRPRRPTKHHARALPAATTTQALNKNHLK